LATRLARRGGDLLLRLGVGLNVALGPFHPEERRVARHLALRFDRSAGSFSPASSFLHLARMGTRLARRGGDLLPVAQTILSVLFGWKRGHSCPRKGARPFTRLPALTKDGSASAMGARPRDGRRKTALEPVSGAASPSRILCALGRVERATGFDSSSRAAKRA